MCRANPRLNTPLYTKIFQRTLPYFSRDLLNVERDWTKVGDFCKHLDILKTDFDQNSIRTNEHVPSTGKPSVAPVTAGGVLPSKTSPFPTEPEQTSTGKPSVAPVTAGGVLPSKTSPFP